MNDLFLRACRRQPVERTPVWIMRQAGRYLPEYREVRERVTFLELCRTPELAAKVTLQPLDRFGLDAAILFSDILVLAEPMGLGLRFEPGPVIDPPVRGTDDIDRLRRVDPQEGVPYVLDTIRLLRRELRERVPLIGFAAAPFTLAAYLVQGRGSRMFEQMKGLMSADPRAAHRLLEKVTESTADYVRAQVEAGAQAIQLFDTWVGLLSDAEFHDFARPYAWRVLEAVESAGVPRIYFGLNANHLLDEIRGCPAEVVGADWRTPLARVSAALEHRHVLQGNLDPCVLLSTPEVVSRRTREVLESARTIPGHVFNLGHGVLPETPPANVATLVRTVREITSGPQTGTR